MVIGNVLGGTITPRVSGTETVNDSHGLAGDSGL